MIPALKTRIPIQVFKLQFPQTKMKLFDGLVFQKKVGTQKNFKGSLSKFLILLFNTFFHLKNQRREIVMKNVGGNAEKMGKLIFPNIGNNNINNKHSNITFHINKEKSNE